MDWYGLQSFRWQNYPIISVISHFGDTYFFVQFGARHSADNHFRFVHRLFNTMISVSNAPGMSSGGGGGKEGQSCQTAYEPSHIFVTFVKNFHFSAFHISIQGYCERWNRLTTLYFCCMKYNLNRIYGTEFEICHYIRWSEIDVMFFSSFLNSFKKLNVRWMGTGTCPEVTHKPWGKRRFPPLK